MEEFLAIRDGGKTDELGFFRFLRRISSNDEGVIQTGDLVVSEKGGGADKSVDIAIGDCAITEGTYLYYVFTTAIVNVAITDNSSGNDRIDAIVAYVDKAIVSAASANNPNALVFVAVAGTPAGSPTAPTDGDIVTAIGAGNPFHRLANVAADNGFAQIVNADITDTRVQFLLGNVKPTIRPFEITGALTVADDKDYHYKVPVGVTSINRLDATIKTAPVGSAATFRVYNITKAQDVGTVTIADGATTGVSTSMTNSAVDPGDILRVDVTAIGSGTAGSNALVQPS